MADWRNLALDCILADGKIGDDEVRVLRKALWADGKINVDEVQFLIDLRNRAQKKAKAKKEEINASFEKLFFKAVEENVLKDGSISANETEWLRRMIFADKKVDASEAKLINSLKKKAKTTSAEFDALCEQVGGGKKKAAKK